MAILNLRSEEMETYNNSSSKTARNYYSRINEAQNKHKVSKQSQQKNIQQVLI